jgi:ABC-2 type transport system permease protein
VRAAWRVSPILIKEMRSTMRGGRTFLGLTLFLLFLAAMTLLVYYSIYATGDGSSAAGAGRAIFIFLSVVQLLMLSVITPPLTAGTIAGERQNQTFDMLMATPLTPTQVLRGKLLASMNYLFLLMFASLPINSIVFLFGGVTPDSLLWWVALTVVLLLMLGTLGLFMSTLFRSGGVATAVAYLFCLIVFVVLPGILGTTLAVMSNTMQAARCAAVAVALLHPVASLAAILVDEPEFHALRLLPATLPLIGAVAMLFFFGAEARLSALVARRWRRPVALLVVLGVIAASVTYIIAVPVQALCAE